MKVASFRTCSWYVEIVLCWQRDRGILYSIFNWQLKIICTCAGDILPLVLEKLMCAQVDVMPY